MRKFGLIVAGVGVLLVVLAGSLAHSYFNAEPRNLGTADRVEIIKSSRRLVLYQGDQILETYSISLGRNPIGHKVQEGDSRTPEGSYVLDWRNRKSKFYRSIHISYPNSEDLARAKQNGLSAGGDIMIHGQPNGAGLFAPLTQLKDWTDGCIAVSDKEMEEIWRAVPNGTPIEIRP